MINVRKLKEVLETSLNDGIDGICLISTDGSLLCSAELNVEIKNTLLAAITSSIYSSSLQSIQNHNQQQQQQGKLLIIIRYL